MRKFKMLGAFIHCFALVIASTVLGIAGWISFPNSHGYKLAWISGGILMFAAVLNTIFFFIHNKDWYKSREDLEKEREKHGEAIMNLMCLRKKYLREFESKEDKN
jgi:uncharacterized membrane protein